MSNKSRVLEYTPHETPRQFHKSDAFVRGLMGPVGAGKTVACCWEIFIRAKQQAPSVDGIRRSRWLVVRNTQPMLETTTIKTWLDWFGEDDFGNMSRKPPFTHSLKFADVELEVVFLALDRPEDEKKLRSLECTGIWFNEARDISKDLIDMATSRVGRYPPSKEKPKQMDAEHWPTFRGIIMDTNPPTDDHWWYEMAEGDAWRKDPETGELEPLENFDKGERWEFFKQPSGLSDDAENIENLPNGQGYYRNMMRGKTKEWINVYIHGNYGFVQDGKPVYGSAWNDDVHTAKKELTPDPTATTIVGMDFGLTPCAIFCQQDSRGQWRILHELVTEDMSTQEFGRLFRREVEEHFPDNELIIYGDPAGKFRAETTAETSFDILFAQGITVRPAPTNTFATRKESVTAPLLRMIDGHPGLLLSPACKQLRRGFNGGYKYRRLQVSGDARHSETPMKNKFSHPHDALQYALMGGGEYQRVLGKRGSGKVRKSSNKGWDVF